MTSALAEIIRVIPALVNLGIGVLLSTPLVPVM
jgi:hypothetical protein